MKISPVPHGPIEPLLTSLGSSEGLTTKPSPKIICEQIHETLEMVSYASNNCLMGLTLHKLFLYTCVLEANRTQKLVKEYLKSKTIWRMDALIVFLQALYCFYRFSWSWSWTVTMLPERLLKGEQILVTHFDRNSYLIWFRLCLCCFIGCFPFALYKDWVYWKNYLQTQQTLSVL